MKAATRWRLMGLVFVLCVPMTDAADDKADFIEFAQPTAAKTFGWQGRRDAELKVVRDAREGEFALRVDAPAAARPYTGLRLRRDIDFTEAGPGDKIVFFVKQNYGSGICLNMHMGGTNVYRYAKIQKGKWRRVEMDLDLSHWSKTKLEKWGKATALQFYSRSFDEPSEYMALDGLMITVNGKTLSAAPDPAHIVERWQFPYETPNAWYLGNSDVAWAISRKTGQVVGGWNATSRERYLNSGEGRYHLEDIKGIVTAREKDDKISDAVFSAADQRIVLTCTNPAIPKLTIRKTYRLSERRLFKETAFTYQGEKTKFITYNSEVAFTPDYRDAGFYMGAGYVGPLVPAPSLSEWKRVLEYQNTSKGMLLHQPEKGFSFAHVRTRLDGRFVWPWFNGAIASYNEEMNVLHYTPNGWDMSLCTSKLERGGAATYEEYFSIAPGGWYEFLSRYYPSMPEVQKASAEIPPVPAWVKSVKAYCSLDRSGIPRVKRLVEATDEGYIIVLVGAWGSFADYYVEEGLVGNSGGFITGPEIKDLIQRIKALSPRVKVGIYQWVLSASYESRILKKHPEWFRRLDKNGEELSTFPGLAPNFASLLSIPECYAELLSQFDRVLRYLDVDFIYLDDPKAVNMVDWRSGEYTRDDLSMRFMLDLRRLVARYGREKMLFFNCRGNPYADVNFIEARSQLRAGYWRHFAGIGSCIEAFLTCRPAARIVPLYWISSLSREYVNRVLALGWIPSMTYGDMLQQRPYTQAAYEIGNSSPAAGVYSPDWKRDRDTLIESYLTQRDGDPGYLLSFISHEETTKTIPISISLDSLDLNRKGTIVVWEHLVADATTFKGRVTERVVKSVYARTGWRLDGVTRRRLLYMGPYRGNLELHLSMAPLILHQLYITDQQAGVYAVDNMPSNYLFSTMANVTARAASQPKVGALRVQVDSNRDTSEIIVYLARDKQMQSAKLDGDAVEPVWIEEGGLVCPLFTIGQGRHVLTIEYARRSGRAALPQHVEATASGESLTILLPGLARAIISVAKEDYVYFSRMVNGRGGVFSAPLSEDRPGGAYRVAVSGGVTADGVWSLDKPISCAVELTPASVDLQLSPKSGPVIPEECRITPINKTIRGVHVLRTATCTSQTTLAGWQPKLKALTASATADKLTLEAGATRKIMNFLGAAFAGMEVRDLRKVKVRLTNTFYNAFHLRGPGNHGPMYWPSPRSFAGFVVDFHTSEGYTKRVNLAVGLLDPNCATPFPKYGKGGPLDEVYDLGKLVDDGPEKTFSLDLGRYAPDGWDGQVWFSVGSDWAGSGRRLKAEILAINEAVKDGFLIGANPKDLMARYQKPRTLAITHIRGALNYDGVLDEEMWGKAAKTDEFFLLGGVGVSEARTLAKLYYDDTRLYMGIRCEEPARRRPIVRHGAVWHDDDVEVFIDANGDGKTYAQICVNGAGEKAEFRDGNSASIGAGVAVHVAEGRHWEIELVVPYAGLGVKPPKPGDVWRFNIVRQRLPTKKCGKQLITWAPLEKGFFELRNFGRLKFK